uniref:Uncharacterized protein n=1 Tax=Myoviridae sp. ctLnO19 TaxID=2825085 RepID=A0A8S5P0E4_9CAUD|nr:MAG TPA: hypothetical protein [Myoviridae sp. ctLnO19]
MILVTEDIIKTFNESSRFTLIKERLALEKVPILSRREYTLLVKNIIIYKLIHTELTLRLANKSRERNNLSTELLSSGLTLTVNNLLDRITLTLPNLSYPTEVILNNIQIILIKKTANREKVYLHFNMDIDIEFLNGFLEEMKSNYQILIRVR